jgi:UDPglucose 6-dehydrogenase
VIAELGDPRGRRVGLLGLAFKAGTDDVRSSPALRLAQTLIELGADVVAHDPMAGPQASRAIPRLAIVPSADEALCDADVAIIATEWPEYADLDWRAIRETMRSPVIFDGRRLLRSIDVAGLGFRYESVGSPAPAREPVSEPVP